MTARRPYSRHGLNTLMTRVKLRGFGAIDRRTAAARSMLDFRQELVAALGGDDRLSPQRRKLVDMTARAALYLDHVDSWLAEQPSLVNHRNRSLLPVLTQRQALADHLARLLDRLGLDRLPQRVETIGDVLATYERPAHAAPDGPRSRQGFQPPLGTAATPANEETAP